MKHRARIVAALVVGLLLLAIPLASASPSSTNIQPAKKYGICLSVNPNLTVCY
jgi:glycerol uptake facilitator-like aquaporin